MLEPRGLKRPSHRVATPREMAEASDIKDDAPATTCRWGFMSCGAIASDFATALLADDGSTPRVHHVVSACASASVARSELFGEKHGIPRSKRHETHSAFLSSPDALNQCDVVYVSILNTQHKAQVLALIELGKNVLCEKPMGLNASEVREMVEAAKRKNVFLGEAMWTRFFPAIRRVREILNDSALGEIVSVKSKFCIETSTESAPRLWDRKLGGGGLLDVGVYTVGMAFLCFGGLDENGVRKFKTKVTRSRADLADGVDVYGVASIAFERVDGATINTHTETQRLGMCAWGIDGNSEDEEICEIQGTAGSLRICSPMHCPTDIVLTAVNDGPRKIGGSLSFDWDFPLPKHDPSKFNYQNSVGLVYEANAVARCLHEGRLEFPEYPLAESIAVHEAMDEIRKQIGVKYDGEE